MVTYKEYKEALKVVRTYESKLPRQVRFGKLRSNYSREQLIKIFDKCAYAGLMIKHERRNFISIFTTGSIKRVKWMGASAHGGKLALFDLMFRITGRIFTPSELHDYFEPDEKLRPNDCGIENGAVKRSRIGNRIFYGV